MTPLISVIVPNLNSLQIDRTLIALRRQQFDLSKVEILVVGLDEPGLVEENDLVRLISSGVPACPAANRNRGIRAAQGDILCFTDADCVSRPDWLDGLTAPFKTKAVHIVGGGVVFSSDNYWTTCDNLSWFHQFLTTAPAGEREHLASLNLAVRRKVIQEVGFFDERFPFAAGEDTDWTVRMRRAGYRLHFEPRAVVEHYPQRADLRALWRHAYNFGHYSPKISPAYQDFLGVSIILRRWWSLLLLSPLLATVATLRIFFKDRALWRFWYTVPGIWISKLAWCQGAAQALRRS